MCRISKGELVWDLAQMSIRQGDTPAGSPYLNRPLRRYEDVATGRDSASRKRPDVPPRPDTADRGERPAAP